MNYSNSPSPINVCELLPWDQYVKLPDKSAKKPTARLCAICRNVFFALGYEDEYKTPEEYHQQMSLASGRDMHHKFRDAREAWIKHAMKNPELFRVSSSVELRG